MVIGRMGRTAALRIAGAFSALLLSTASAWAQYDFVPVPAPSGSQAIGSHINNGGNVVGYFRSSGIPFRGFVHQSGFTTELSTLGARQYTA